MAEEVDEFLAHYGVVGMKWGKRKGGLKERVKGAHLDSLQRRIEGNKAVAEGRGQVRDYARAFAPKGGGKVAPFKSTARVNVKNLETMKSRVEKGKTNVWDKLDAIGNVKVSDLVVSRQDKRGLEGATKDKVNSGKVKAAKILAGVGTVVAASVAANYAKNEAKKGAINVGQKAYEKKKAQNNFQRNKPAYDRASDSRGIANYSTVRLNYDAANDSWG